MSTSGKSALYKNLAQNANNAEAAKARYLRSGVYVEHVTRGRGHLGPQGYNLNKLSKGSPGDATYQNIKALGLVVSDKKILLWFSL